MAIDKNEIKKLIEDVDKKSLNLTSEQKNEIAKALADFLKKEKDDNYLGHYTIKQDDVNNKNSLFDDFQKLIDLDSQDSHYLQYIEDIIKDQNNGSHENWNESIKYIVEYFRTHFRPYSQGNEIEVYKYDENGNKIGTQPAIRFSILQDILKANAGYSFKNSPWVMPNINIDEQSYDNVRGADKIKTVLNSQKNMDFTHTQTTGQVDSEGKQKDDGNQVTKYIRLLMPRYTRRVEVEDLNRNFWVIGQVLTAVCAYLFDDDSPIMNMFKRLLNENVQIWENLLYLWAAVSLLGEKDYVPYDSDHIRCEVVYLPNDQWNHEMKFDGYDVETIGSFEIDSEQYKERLSYMPDIYPNKHLCILPIVRKDNYYKNYYKQEYYPGFIFYDANTGVWSYQSLNNEGGVIVQVEVNNNNPPELLDQLYCIKEENGQYSYYGAAATIAISDDEYIRAIRSKIEKFGCTWNGGFVPYLQVNVYDAGYYAIKGTIQDGQEKICISLNIADIEDYTDKSRSGDHLIKNTDTGSGSSMDQGNYQRGIYLCELITRMGTPNIAPPKPTPEPTELGFEVVSIGSFFPYDILNHNSSLNPRFEMITSKTPGERFNVQTYGYGCYVIKKDNLIPFNSNTNLYFAKNNDFFTIPGMINNNAIFNAQTRYLDTVTPSILRSWGSEYLQTLLNNNKINNNRIYITRIGVSYWTGANGTVWNNGIFCDMFAIINNKIEHIAPLYIFDGYWTNNGYVFTSGNNESAWRQLYMTGAGTYEPQKSGTAIYKINGTIQWNDHRKEIHGDITGTTDRPYCSYSIDTSRTEKIIYSNYNWSNTTKQGSRLGNEQMIMRLSQDNLWDFNHLSLSDKFLNFANGTNYLPLESGKDGYILYNMSSDSTYFTLGKHQ